jgi:hypothetical protein
MSSKTLADLRTFTRVLLSEPVQAIWTDQELNTYINDGIDDFCTETDCIECLTTNSTVQYQADYAAPANVTKIKYVEIVKGNSTYQVIPEDLQEQFHGTVKSTSNPPEFYNFWEGNLRLRERPSVSAQSNSLASDINSSDTSLVLNSTSNFPRMGRLLIDNEVIAYWSIATDGITLNGLQRGLEGSVAAAHSTSAVVTLRDMYIYHYKKENLTSDLQVTSIPSQFDEAVCYFAAAVGRRKSKDHDLAAEYMKAYTEYKAKAINWVKFKWKRTFWPK